MIYDICHVEQIVSDIYDRLIIFVKVQKYF